MGTVSVEQSAGIGRLTLNQLNKRNAISLAMWRGISEAMAAFSADPAVRVVIVSGAGDQAFSAGADISEFDALRSTEKGRAAYQCTMQAAFDALTYSPKLTIAQIDGICIGGGAEVAMECDIQIASDRARFAITPAKLGIALAFPDVERLVRHVGEKYAKEILATGRMFSAGEAWAMGWINHVLPQDRLHEYVDDMAQTISNNAPLSIRAAKFSINEAVKAPEDRDMQLCTRLVNACYASADHLEGKRAFAEKRSPNFKGE